MDVFIESLTTEFTVFDGDLPLSDKQMDQIVARVLSTLERLDLQQRSERSFAAFDRGFEETYRREAHQP